MTVLQCVCMQTDTKMEEYYTYNQCVLGISMVSHLCTYRNR